MFQYGLDSMITVTARASSRREGSQDRRAEGGGGKLVTSLNIQEVCFRDICGAMCWVTCRPADISAMDEHESTH